MSSHGTITEPSPRQFKTTPQPQPEVPPVVTPPTPTGQVLYDMNRDIDFSKDLKFDEYRGPTGIRIHTEASGSPRGYIVAATKELILEHDGKYGRFYFEVPNYNGVLEGEFKLQDCDQNASFKTRSRHQYRDEKDSKASDSQVQGGLGCAFHCDSVENKIEVVHGGATACDQSKTLPTKLVANRYYKFRFTYFDKDGKIYEKDELDYGNGFVTLAEYNCTAPSQFFNKAEFLQWSEFWIRLNDVNGGRLAVKNVRLVAI